MNEPLTNPLTGSHFKASLFAFVVALVLANVFVVLSRLPPLKRTVALVKLSFAHDFNGAPIRSEEPVATDWLVNPWGKYLLLGRAGLIQTIWPSNRAGGRSVKANAAIK